jgi:hypothetical protein
MTQGAHARTFNCETGAPVAPSPLSTSAACRGLRPTYPRNPSPQTTPPRRRRRCPRCTAAPPLRSTAASRGRQLTHIEERAHRAARLAAGARTPSCARSPAAGRARGCGCGCGRAGQTQPRFARGTTQTRGRPPQPSLPHSHSAAPPAPAALPAGRACTLPEPPPACAAARPDCRPARSPHLGARYVLPQRRGRPEVGSAPAPALAPAAV